MIRHTPKTTRRRVVSSLVAPGLVAGFLLAASTVPAQAGGGALTIEAKFTAPGQPLAIAAAKPAGSAIDLLITITNPTDSPQGDVSNLSSEILPPSETDTYGTPVVTGGAGATVKWDDPDQRWILAGGALPADMSMTIRLPMKIVPGAGAGSTTEVTESAITVSYQYADPTTHQPVSDASSGADIAATQDRAPNASELPAVTPVSVTRVNGKIAFTSHRDGNYEIYTMNPDGSDQVNVTKTGPSPDSSGRGIDDRDPSWSPDGTKIAFDSIHREQSGGYYDIYSMNADGSGVTRLTTNEDSDNNPTWSPDGTRIAFTSRRDGADNVDVYVMNADGSNQVNLTHSEGDEYDPAWSPDSKKIVFESDREGSTQIYTMNADGSAVTDITNAGPVDSDGPSWSPDGTKIAFSSRRGSSADIFTMDPNGANLVNVTNSAGDQYFPAWSPDGKKIAYMSPRASGEFELFTMNADGSGQTQRTTNPGGDGNFDADWQGLPAPVPPPCCVPPPVGKTFIGTAKKDVIQGTPGDDFIIAKGGNDVVYGNGGNDVINGGAGNDKIYGGDGNDTLKGGTGLDKCDGGPGTDTAARNCEKKAAIP